MKDVRAETVIELANACSCYERLKKLLPTCTTDEERTRVQCAIDHFEGEISRLGERMLQFARSGHAVSTTAH
ncbi:MAG: hypothetical protein WDN31_05625 [Hyphomicrobium sp.]